MSLCVVGRGRGGPGVTRGWYTSAASGVYEGTGEFPQGEGLGFQTPQVLWRIAELPQVSKSVKYGNCMSFV